MWGGFSLQSQSNHVVSRFPLSRGSSLNLPGSSSASHPPAIIASLRDIDWENYESILIIKRLPTKIAPGLEPVLAYFERNGIHRTWYVFRDYNYYLKLILSVFT